LLETTTGVLKKVKNLKLSIQESWVLDTAVAVNLSDEITAPSGEPKIVPSIKPNPLLKRKGLMGSTRKSIETKGTDILFKKNFYRRKKYFKNLSIHPKLLIKM
jgi:hypothetical protein